MAKDFQTAMEERRTIYGIGADIPVSDEKVTEIIRSAVKHVPSAFNSQSARVAVLFGDSHKQLWNIVTKTLRSFVPAEKFAPTEEKINSFAAGHGTVLYFDDTSITQGFANKYTAYRDNFRVWAEQANGMLQFAVWSLLEAEGLGVNLQHYNPLIDDEVKLVFSIPTSWRLIAQMPFGSLKAAAGEKSFVPVEDRVKILF